MGFFPTYQEIRGSTSYSKDGLNNPRFWSDYAGGVKTKSGATVTEKNSLMYSTLWSCVTLISGDIAGLPAILYRTLPGGGKERVVDHPAADIINNAANPETDAFLWRETLQGHLLRWGNGYATIERERYRGRVKALWQIEPDTMRVKREGNTLTYRWTDDGKSHVRPASEMLHIKGFSHNGLMGLSPIGLHREAIGLGLTVEEFESRYFGEGTFLSGIVSVPDDVDFGENEEEYKKKIKKSYSGLRKSHGVLILTNGEGYQSATLPLKDAQFLELRKFQSIEICAIYHVPPHKVSIHDKNANRNNLEQENTSYVVSCLLSWVKRWEKIYTYSLLSEEDRKAGLFIELLVEGLLRGDSQARADFYTKQLANGAMSPNEIRAKENLNPLPGNAGDQYFVPLNFIPLDQAQQGIEQTPRDQRHRQKKAIEERSIIARERISRNYKPLFKAAAQKIINLEANAVSRKVEQNAKRQSGKASLQNWLDDFYRKLPDKIKKEMGPVFRAFSNDILRESIKEIGVDVLRQRHKNRDEDPESTEDEIKEQYEKFVSDYINGYVERHVFSSHGQLIALLRDKDPEAVEERVEEWKETRADKIAANETTRNSNAIFQFVAFFVGRGIIWRARGAETCPYCLTIAGKRIVDGESFLNPGDVLDPEKGTGPMKIRGLTKHPPLHQGCDCYLSAG